MDLFVSWSGGKDCALACHRAIKAGHKIRYLTSMFTTEVGRLYPHHFIPELIERQAEAMDVPLILNWTTAKEYTKNFIKMLQELRKEGITGGVFGDVSLGNPDSKNHRRWIEGVCQAADIEIFLPLWDEDRESIISDLIDSGFEAIIIAADDDKLGKSWLGQKLDRKMLAELKSLRSNSHDGGVGLYHTFVLDGPLFNNRLEIFDYSVVYKKYGLYNGRKTLSPFWYLDIQSCALA